MANRSPIDLAPVSPWFNDHFSFSSSAKFPWPCDVGPSPRISHFSKSLWFLLEETDIQTNLALHVFVHYKASKWSQRIQPGNIYKKTQDVETRSKQTKGMLTPRRWVRSGTERIEQGNQTDIIYNFNMLIHTTTHEFKLVASILVWTRVLSSL